MERRRDHAIVLGGSMAGVLAARVLADRYDRVTIVDRDRFPAAGEARRGVPQGRHIHALLTRGKRAIDRLFPGVEDELVALGAIAGELGRDATFAFSGTRLCGKDSDLELLTVSRPVLEGHLRARVLDLPNVGALEGCDVHGFTTDDDGGRVTGVRILPRADGSAERTLPAALVVDATGRASRTPTWLQDIGYAPPEEEGTPVDVAYTSCRYPRHPDDPHHLIILGAKFPSRRGGGAQAAEGDTWVVTLAGVQGEKAPTDPRGFVEYAASLAQPDLYELVRDREPLTEPVLMRYPSTSRRHYDRLTRFPDGLVVTGDAVCSFNPVYGQGMSVAAVAAEELALCLDAGDEGIGPRFFDAIRGTVDVAWGMAASADARYQPDATPPARSARVLNRYLERLNVVAGHDPVVAAAFLEVMSLVSHPRSLLHPRIVWRVLTGAGRNGGRRDVVAPPQRQPVPGHLDEVEV